MNVGFASGSALKRGKADSDKDAFSLFSNKVPSTLGVPELRLMIHARNLSAAPAPPVVSAAQKRSASVMEGPAPRRRAAEAPPGQPQQQQQQQQRAIPLRADFYSLDRKMQLDIIGDIHAETIKEMQRNRKCVLCNDRYSEMLSIGQHQCRWHPGELNEVVNPENGRLVFGWSCCGSPYVTNYSSEPRISGCCFCDHTDKPYSKLGINTRSIPMVLSRLMKVPQHHISKQDLPKSADGRVSVNDVKIMQCVVLQSTTRRDEYVAQMRMPAHYNLSRNIVPDQRAMMLSIMN